MGNVIPRKATRLKVDFKANTSHFNNGDSIIISKTDRGWIGEDNKGNSFRFLVGLLRNENYCSLSVLG